MGKVKCKMGKVKCKCKIRVLVWGLLLIMFFPQQIIPVYADDAYFFLYGGSFGETQYFRDTVCIKDARLLYGTSRGTVFLAEATNNGLEDTGLLSGTLYFYDGSGRQVKTLKGLIGPMKPGETVQINSGISSDWRSLGIQYWKWVLDDTGESSVGAGGISNPIPVFSVDSSEVANAVRFRLEDYLADIETENTTVYGPSMNIFGKEFYLFEIDAKTKINSGNLKAEVSYDTESKLIKVLIGVDTSGKAGIDGTADNRMCNAAWSKEYNEFKNLYKQMTGYEAHKSHAGRSYWNDFEKLKGKMNKFQCNLMVTANMWASGYMEWSYETGTLKFSEGGLIEEASIGAKLQKTIPQIPLCYWFVGVTADEKGNFIFKKVGETITTDFSLTPSMKAEIGIGMGKNSGKYATYLEGSLDGTLAATIANTSPQLKVTLDGNLHARGYAVGYELLNKTFPFPQWQIYPVEQSSAYSLKKLVIGDANTALNEAKPISRDYLADNYELLKGNTYSADDSIYRQDNIFPYAEPKLFSLSGGRLLLLYVGDDGTKTLNNRASLMYSIYDGITWSETEKLAESGTWADGIGAYQSGDTIYVSYRKAGKEFSDDVAVEEMLSNMELSVSVFDGTAFGTEICINDDKNELLESGQILYEENGTLTVAWLENSENNIFLDSGMNSLHMRSLTGGILSEEIVVLETEQVISEINLGSINGRLSCVFGVQNEEQTEVYLYQNGGISRILTGYENPQEFTLKDGKFYFLNNAQLYCYDGQSVSEEKGALGLSNYQILSDGNTSALITNVEKNAGSELMVSFMEKDEWTAFAPYTAQDGFIRDYCAVFQGGEVLSVINRLEVDESMEGGVGAASLIVTGEEAYYNLQADYVWYDEAEVQMETNLPLEIGVTNMGKNIITSITATVNDSEGKELAKKTFSCALKAGASDVLFLDLPISQKLCQKEVYITLAIPQAELEQEDNRVSTEIYYADLAVSDVTCKKTEVGTFLIEAKVVNQGLEDMPNVSVSVYNSGLSGDKLTGQTIGILRAGESRIISLELTEAQAFSAVDGQLNALMLYVESDTSERNYINNEVRIVYNTIGIVIAGATNTEVNTINITTPIFDDVIYGYKQPDEKAIMISNNGDSDVTISRVEVEGNEFIIYGSGLKIDPNATVTTWTIQPKEGLSIGIHTAMVTVTYNDGATAKAEVTFVVKNREKNMPTADMFTFTAPGNLIYDGQAKAASVVSSQTGMGDMTLKYYRQGETTGTMTAPTDAGAYLVKISLEEGADYGAVSDLTADSWMFMIAKAQVTVSAEDKAVAVGGEMPELTYTVSGLVNGERLEVMPTLTCSAADTNAAGSYVIAPSGAVAGSNYEVAYRNGTLTVAAPETYTVTFESNGGSTVVSQMVSNGDVAVVPLIPTKSGYTFAGWYVDKEFFMVYSFTAPVTADITLYAKWTANSSGGGTGGGGSSSIVPPSNTVTTKPDGTVVVTKMETKLDGTKFETRTETAPDGRKVEIVTETKLDGTVVVTKTETKPDGTKVETQTETAPDGRKVEIVTETKLDGTVVVTKTETKPDGTKVETQTETAPDGRRVRTVTETKPDGSIVITVVKTIKNSVGRDAVVTTTTKINADGIVNSVTEKTKIVVTTVTTSIVVTVRKNGEGEIISAKATITKTAKTTKSNISATMITQIVEAAGTNDVLIVMTVKDTEGNVRYKVRANAEDIYAGNKLYIYRLNTTTGNYTMVDDKTYKVTKAGNIYVIMTKKATYELVDKATANRINQEIKETIVPKKTSVTMWEGLTTTFALGSDVNKKNVASILYTTGNKSIAIVSKNGKIIAKGRGITSIKAVVTLKNGLKKTIKMEIKVK